MTRRKLPWVSAVALLTVFPAASSAQSRASGPDLSGMWNSSTATPLQRPRDLADKPFFTPAEAAEWERRFAERNREPPPDAPRRGTGTFNTVYREFGTSVVKTLRTSIITEPPDGRLPPLRPAYAEARRRHIEAQRRMENPEALSLQDRCVAFSTSGPPILPYTYNGNVQIVQTRDAVVVHSEMIHDARIIYLDGRPPPPASVRLPSGHSVGRWEADTLVVETTNFDDSGGFYGSAGGDFGWSRDRRVSERFSLYDAETLIYRFEIDDPTAFTRPWQGELTLSRTSGNIYEYACHEGNYSLEGMMRGARTTEAGAGGQAGR